jgi:hypothetical protein
MGKREKRKTPHLYSLPFQVGGYAVLKAPLTFIVSPSARWRSVTIAEARARPEVAPYH